jgi:hypothetical protein
MTDKHRLQLLADALNLSIRQMEGECKIPYSTLSAAIRRNSRISGDIVDKIIDKYQKVNPEWLKKGTGEMFLPEQKNTLSEPEVNYEAMDLATIRAIREIMERYRKHFSEPQMGHKAMMAYKTIIDTNSMPDILANLLYRVDKLEGH